MGYPHGTDMLITEAMRLVGYGHTAPFPRPSLDAPAPEFRRFGTFDDFNEERNLDQLGKLRQDT